MKNAKTKVEYARVVDAAWALGVSTQTIRRWVRRNVIAHRYYGRTLLVSLSPRDQPRHKYAATARAKVAGKIGRAPKTTTTPKPQPHTTEENSHADLQ